MNTLWRCFRLALACGLGLVDSRTLADLEVTAAVQIRSSADFEAPLATRGSWIEVRSYGRCWRPAGIVVGWRPYCEGQWVWTDCGWYWQSDEPWAWACYHYGWWVLDPVAGWVWVPGIEWAPAWVCWRTGGGYIGWAPCGPHGSVIEPGLFVFVGADHFGARVRSGTVIVNNTTVFKNTTQITRVARETREIAGSRRTVLVNQGPVVEQVQKATGRKMSEVPVQVAASRTWIPPDMVRKSSQPEHKSEAPVAQERSSRPGPEVPANPHPAEGPPTAKAPGSTHGAPPDPDGRGNGAEHAPHKDHDKGDQGGKP